jgi:uncharacterized membrane protein YgaE (UPF0421/DUF939 family)
MADVRGWMPLEMDRESVVHAARTALAAIVSMYVAQLCKLPEAYWAAVTTLIVMQSTLGAALKVSGRRLAGTALGAAAGALLAARFGANVIAFGAGVFALGLVCAVLRLERNAYRYAGVTLAVVMLVSRDRVAWIVAAHRFVEVSIGIVVGLALTALWPERVASE